jgi:hypothetical protein
MDLWFNKLDILCLFYKILEHEVKKLRDEGDVYFDYMIVLMYHNLETTYIS